MRLRRARISKSTLLAMPESERHFFVQCGNLLNELSTLLKLVQFSSNVHGTQRPVIRAQGFQSLFLMQILAGKLWEGWMLLKRGFFGTKLSKEFEPNLSPVGGKSLGSLKTYFGRSNNVIHTLRDEFAFHYSRGSSEQIDRAIHRLDDQAAFEMFFADVSGNCFYDISSSLMSLAIVEWTNTPDYRRALSTLLQEVRDVTELFVDFLGACVVLISRRYPFMNAHEVEIPDPSDASTIACPYFVRVART